MIPGITAQKVAAGGGYVGPLDLVPGAVVAMDINFAPAAANIGTEVFIIDTNIDTLQVDYGSDGQVDGAAILAFLNGDTGTPYDFQNKGSFAGILQESASISWDSDIGGGIPGLVSASSFLTVTPAPSASSGAKSFILIGNFVTNPGHIVFTLDDGAEGSLIDAVVTFNVSGDIGIEQTPAEGFPFTTWATSGTISDGKHILQVSISALGAVTVKVDGVDLSATIASGDPLVPPAIITARLRATLNADALTAICAFYVWEGAVDVSPAVANLAQKYGITLP